MSDDDDWFERALREDEESTDSAASDSEREGTASASENDGTASAFEGEGDTSSSEGEFATSGSDDGDAAEESVREDRDDPDEWADSGAGFGDGESDSASGAGESDSTSGGFADADPYDADDADADDALFEDDFASAFENAPGGVGPAGEGPGSGGGGAGSASGEDDPAGGFGGGGDFGMGSDEEFTGGFGGGFGESGASAEDDFDDEEFESSIPRIDVGIEGLDDMIQGGVPERSLMTTIGSAGTGKTTFGLQFLHEALQQGENAVFITLEESHERIVSTATEKGWNFEEYVDEGRLAVIDLDPIEMANSLTSIRNDLPRLVEEFGASRLVLDSVSLLEMMYDDQATRRNEVYDFTKSLKDAGVTTMLTSEASEETPYASRHGIIEYLVDAVFVLRYIRGSDDFRETRLAVEIQKIRDANHSREIKPYAITNEGISVYRQANIF